MDDNKKICFVTSPVTGKIIPVEEVKDQVFSQKILGDGVAIIPENGNVCSPVSGEIISVAETLHAFGIKCDCGVEILIHIGIDSISLDGIGYTSCVKVGERVEAGQPICTVELDIRKIIGNRLSVKIGFLRGCVGGIGLAGCSFVTCYT